MQIVHGDNYFDIILREVTNEPTGSKTLFPDKRRDTMPAQFELLSPTNLHRAPLCSISGHSCIAILFFWGLVFWQMRVSFKGV